MTDSIACPQVVRLKCFFFKLSCHYLICDICHKMWEHVRNVWQREFDKSDTDWPQVLYVLLECIWSRRQLSHPVSSFEALKCSHSCTSHAQQYFMYLSQTYFTQLINVYFSATTHRIFQARKAVLQSHHYKVKYWQKANHCSGITYWAKSGGVQILACFPQHL